MRVAVLVENTASGECAGEHGLSIYIEHRGKKYLIDTGQTGMFSENARKMQIDLSEVDTAFLSHAHYDHSGGYNEFFGLNSKAKVYLQETCRGMYYYKIAGPVKKYVGIPKGILEKYQNRFFYVNGYMDLGDGVYICPHTTEGLDVRGKRAHMYGEIDGTYKTDDFSHEQTIVFEEKDGLYLFNSCSHGGVENIIEEIAKQFPGKEIKAFFGGFHMMGTLGVNSCAFSEAEVKGIANKLLSSCNATFYTGHCTGVPAGKWLKEVLDNRYVELFSGMDIIRNQEEEMQ